MRALAFAIALVLAACGGIEHTVHVKVPVQVVDGESGCRIEARHDIDLMKNEDFAKYGDHVEAITLVSARVEVVAVGEGNEATVATGSVKVVDSQDAVRTLFDYALPLETGKSIDVVLDDGAAKALERSLEAPPHRARLEIRGGADETPCQFAFVIDAEVAIVVSPLGVFAQAGKLPVDERAPRSRPADTESDDLASGAHSSPLNRGVSSVATLQQALNAPLGRAAETSRSLRVSYVSNVLPRRRSTERCVATSQRIQRVDFVRFARCPAR